MVVYLTGLENYMTLFSYKNIVEGRGSITAKNRIKLS